MSWQISAGSTSVTFPVNPQNITDESPIVETDFQVDGQQSVVVNEGLDVRVLTLKGFFYNQGQNKAYLDTTFVMPLQGLNGEVVTLTSPTTRYNGTWLLIVKSVEEKAEGQLQRYTYTLILKQGAAYLVLPGSGSSGGGSGVGGSIPSGAIIMWSGTIANIPSGWILCDGTNGTPDLRNTFIVGASMDDSGVAKTNLTGSLTQVGGSISHHHADHSLTQPAIANHNITQPAVSDHAITQPAIADHLITQPAVNSHSVTQPAISSHTYTTSAARTSTASTANAVTAVSAHSLSTNVAVSSHTLSTNVSLSTHSLNTNVAVSSHALSTSVAVDAHSLSISVGVGSHDTLSATQPYYALAFIMKT